MSSFHRLAGGLLACSSILAISSAASAQVPGAAIPQTPPAPGASGALQPQTSEAGAAPSSQPDTEQNAQDTPAEVAAADSPTTAAADASAEDIVVTGSRTLQNGNSSPTPVTVVSTGQLAIASPRNVIDALQTLPSVQGSGPRTVGNTSGNGNSGGRTLNLRGVGVLRTLVLFDGQRLAPTSVGGEVSVDIVPSMLLQRVDIVTGGASAVYGSDAVAGVVNFITDRAYNGVKLDAQSGISKYGDGGQVKLGAAFGKKIFGDRAHIEASYEFEDNAIIDTKQKRPWFNYTEITGLGTAASPYVRTVNTRNGNVSPAGNFNNVAGNGVLRDTIFRDDGALSPFIHGNPTGTTGFESGGEGEYFPFASLAAGSRTHKAFGRFDLDVTDGIHFYAQGAALWLHNVNRASNVRFANVAIGRDNAFLQQSLTLDQRAAVAAGTTRQFTFSKSLLQAGGVTPDTHSTGLTGMGGFEGKIGGWRWDLGYTYSRNSQKTYVEQNVDRGKAFAALDAVVNPANGLIVCNVTLTNPSAYPGCVPINMFGPTAASQEAIDYLLELTGYKAVTTQTQIGGSIAGSPLSTWAGPVQVALSGEYRKLKLDSVSNVQPNDPINCTGIRYNTCNATLAKYQTFAAANATGRQSVKEGAIEVDVPLLRDVRFAKDLSINAAARYTDYQTSGGATTWKVGFTWSPDDQLTLRGTRSRDIRAPNLSELFAPSSLGPGTIVDRHLVGNPQITTFSETTANPNLVPEVANTYTVGLVLKPHFLPSFSLAVDYFDIRIDNAITTLSGANATVQNLCEASNGTSSFCDLIVRPLPFSDRSAANAITRTIQRPVNAASFKTRGVDVEANYRTTVFNNDLSLRGLLTYQPTSETQQGQGFPVLQDAGVPPLTKLRAVGQVTYAINDFTFSLQERWRNSGTYNADRTLVFNVPKVPAAAFTNVTFTFETGPSQFFIAVENLFDRDPTPFSTAPTVAPGTQLGVVPGDDLIGRFITAGVRLRM